VSRRPVTRPPAVLLISPGIIKWTDMDFGLPHMVSMGGYLQAHLDVRVELLDLNYEGGDQRQLERTLEELGPFLLIGVSCFSSFDYLRSLALGRFLKRLYPDVPLVTGGYHASALPGDLDFPGSPFDAVVQGEGERPLLEIVQTLLGGERLEKRRFGPDNIARLDDLPPYKWSLLDRYWKTSRQIGRKFQIYLSRGCPYHCTFCMERAKTEYRWRAYSAERALDELARLARATPLSHWIVNLADPLFGFQRAWRRRVLQGIVDQRLFPRQYWTLTRSDDLDAEDVSLLARARFSIGIGLESGSPTMLREMQKGNDPHRYLERMLRLARLSRDHGLNWATNVIVGHPGETRETMRETAAYVEALFTSAGETCGWLSIDPFRLYPGAYVHQEMAAYGQRFGTRFYHPEWWKSWYDGSFRAEHLDPSHDVDFETRVRFMYDTYGPLLGRIAERFRGQGRSVDRVFAQSMSEQARLLSPRMRDEVLARGRAARKALAALPRPSADGASAHAPERAESHLLALPIGLQVRDPWVREREGAVRRLLEAGVLRSQALVEALLQVAPETLLDEDAARASLRDRTPPLPGSGASIPWLPVGTIAMALEALEPAPGDRAVELAAANGYVAALLASLVTERGEVLALTTLAGADGRRLARSLRPWANVSVRRADGTGGVPGASRPFDRAFLGGAVPQIAKGWRETLRDPEGRLVAFVGPRFRAQDLVALVRRGDDLEERVVTRAQVPILAGRSGWVRGETAS
jgi:radical SAM superfamily enzyme YgiQ (UPF0313 family)/protein-L-isoaspartate O-methyltransferase